ncbi:MAG: LacI family transcriptional regulator [Gaiellaceae bacterium MAG52_C11]|nr:LacI family transcriptional regulator [Candidatus Gaiellasilicea maunaloa]
MAADRQSALPTLADVAVEARVSASTASRALQGSPRISAVTTSRVRVAARRLGYQPNRIARSLRTRSADLVGIVVPDIGIGFYSRVIKGAQDVLEKTGYHVLVASTERTEAREHATLRTLSEHRVNGILLATTGRFDFDLRVPVVFFDNLVPHAGVANVARANKEGMELLVAHLVSHGHSKIGYIGGPATSTSGRERLQGFAESLGARRLETPEEYVQLADAAWSPAGGGSAMTQLLGLRAPPTAIVTSSDTLALGAMRAARQAGLRLPNDLALVSFDDPAFGELLDPPITALACNDWHMGELAASLLLHALDNHAVRQPTEVRTPVELIVRSSCGCSEVLPAPP